MGDGIFGNFADDDDSVTLTDDRTETSYEGAKSTDSLPNVSSTVPPPKMKQMGKKDGIFGNFADDDDSVTLTDDRSESSYSGAKSTDSLPNVSATVPPPKKLSKADGIFGNFADDDDTVMLTDDRSESSYTGAKSTD